MDRVSRRLSFYDYTKSSADRSIPIRFNGGSTFAANVKAAVAITNTNLAASFGGLFWMLMDWRLERKWSAVGYCTGAICGLVAITPAAGFVGYGCVLELSSCPSCPVPLAVDGCLHWRAQALTTRRIADRPSLLVLSQPSFPTCSRLLRVSSLSMTPWISTHAVSLPSRSVGDSRSLTETIRHSQTASPVLSASCSPAFSLRPRSRRPTGTPSFLEDGSTATTCKLVGNLLTSVPFGVGEW